MSSPDDQDFLPYVTVLSGPGESRHAAAVMIWNRRDERYEMDRTQPVDWRVRKSQAAGDAKLMAETLKLAVHQS